MNPDAKRWTSMKRGKWKLCHVRILAFHFNISFYSMQHTPLWRSKFGIRIKKQTKIETLGISHKISKLHRDSWSGSFDNLKPVFTSRKLSQTLSVKENKPPIVNTQCVVYLFQCDLCDANYVGYTARHLHQRISEHRYSAIGKHLETQHGNNKTKTGHLFKVLRKCNSKFDCLVYEMLYIKDIKPSLNT